jgi:hypothetical protein
VLALVGIKARQSAPSDELLDSMDNSDVARACIKSATRQRVYLPIDSLDLNPIYFAPRS